MGTTVATNALLERSADSCALVVSKGHADLLRIGDQTRPKLFDLNIRRAAPLFSDVLEIDERVTLEEYTEDPAPKSAAELDLLVDDVQVVKGVGGELVRILKPLSMCSHSIVLSSRTLLTILRCRTNENGSAEIIRQRREIASCRSAAFLHLSRA